MAVVSPFPRNNSCSSFIGRDRKARLGTTGSPAIKKSEFEDCQPSPKKPLHRSKSDSSKEPLPCYKSDSSKESSQTHDVPASKEPLPCYKSDSSKETNRIKENLLKLLWLLHRPAKETLKAYLGAVIGLSRDECKDGNKFDEKLREALEKHTDALRRFNLQVHEMKKLESYKRKTIQYYDLVLPLIHKLIVILGIAECKEDWLWYQLKRDGASIAERDGVVKDAIEMSMTEILESLNLSKEEREAVFEMRPYDELSEKHVKYLISFFDARYNMNVVVSSDSFDLKPLLLKVIGKDPDFDDARPDDINHQLSRILPKYTILSGWRKVCPKYRPMNDTLRSNLVKCRNVDRSTCTFVAPYFAKKELTDRNLSPSHNCNIEDLGFMTSLLDDLPATSPEWSLEPSNWLLDNLRIDVLCQYRYCMFQKVIHGCSEDELKTHYENIRLLFYKLDQEMVFPKLDAVLEDTTRESVIITVYEINSVLHEMSRLLSVQNTDAEDTASASRLLMECKRCNKRGQYQRALDTLQRKPNLSGKDVYEYFYQCALSFLNLGRSKEAEENFKMALQNLPIEQRAQSSFIYTDYAALLIGQDKCAEADRLLVENSIARDWKYNLALGKYHFAAGRYDDAFAEYGFAASLVTDNTLNQAIVSSYLANVYLKRGDFCVALDTYKDVLKIVKALSGKRECDASQIADLYSNLVDAFDSVREVQEALKRPELLN